VALDPERWTLKTREAFSAANEQAAAAHHAEITPAHLVAAVLSQPDNIAGPILSKLGADPEALRTASARSCPGWPAPSGVGADPRSRRARGPRCRRRAAPRHG